ncbi:MAG: hypothetical protein AVDCRST_MAG01-01-3299 [uncultured Rubrobacteraceae bacterium]|uniref:Uncharacterized protein n=1 Tax=uncultured Rubrobacteraceae bacterium TaxID=349277 RepID=A0A6J4Q799_9ACTN|nr:MAG: hypothetical protein AVDCRST_MAG01-01-3299 [uncultured Rubrobacteraceae bacterium]
MLEADEGRAAARRREYLAAGGEGFLRHGAAEEPAAFLRGRRGDGGTAGVNSVGGLAGPRGLGVVEEEIFGHGVRLLLHRVLVRRTRASGSCRVGAVLPSGGEDRAGLAESVGLSELTPARGGPRDRGVAHPRSR